MSEPLGMVLLNLGGPRDEASIRPFLYNLLSDPAMLGMPGWVRRPLAGFIARRRAPRVAERYARIGGQSPVVEESAEQATALEQMLDGRALVRPLMRYTEPRADQVLDELRQKGVRRLLALPAYPQFSSTTTGSSVAELEVAAAARGMDVSVAEAYPTAPGFIDALAQATVPLLSPGCHVLMTAHGLPVRVIERGDPYLTQVQQTAAALATSLPDNTPWSLGFQSRFGPLRWLQPFVDQELARLARAGVQDLVVVPLTFAVECLETLYDLDVVAPQQAAALGIASYRRAPAPGCHPSFVAALAQVARTTAARAGWLDLQGTDLHENSEPSRDRERCHAC